MYIYIHTPNITKKCIYLSIHESIYISSYISTHRSIHSRVCHLSIYSYTVYIHMENTFCRPTTRSCVNICRNQHRPHTVELRKASQASQAQPEITYAGMLFSDANYPAAPPRSPHLLLESRNICFSRSERFKSFRFVELLGHRAVFFRILCGRSSVTGLRGLLKRRSPETTLQGLRRHHFLPAHWTAT